MALPTNVRISIRSVCGSSPTPREVQDLVWFSHRLAAGYLARKIKSGRLDPSFFNVDVDDLALDFVAPLFRRDETGEFVRLKRYFSSVDLDARSDEEVGRRVRMLVYREVEDELFRLYGQIDPDLSKLIRNLKSAARDSEEVVLERTFGKLWIRVKNGEADSDSAGRSRPVIRPEVLQSRLGSYLKPYVLIPEVVGGLVRILTDQHVYRRAVPVNMVAKLVRAGLASLDDQSDIIRPDRDDSSLHPEEVRAMIECAVRGKEEEKRTSYVKSGKVDEETYHRYFRAIRDILVDQFLGVSSKSYLDHLTVYVDISRQEYRSEHRSRFEYLVRLAREDLFRIATRELDSMAA